MYNEFVKGIKELYKINLGVDDDERLLRAQGAMYIIMRNNDALKELLLFEYEQKKEAYKTSRGTETENSSKASLDKIHENYFNILYNYGALYYNKGVAKLKSIEDISDNKRYQVEREKAEEIMVKALPLLEKALELKPADRSTITSLKDLYARTEDNINWERMQQLLEN